MRQRRQKLQQNTRKKLDRKREFDRIEFQKRIDEKRMNRKGKRAG